jgi:hypothetical protein
MHGWREFDRAKSIEQGPKEYRVHLGMGAMTKNREGSMGLGRAPNGNASLFRSRFAL